MEKATHQQTKEHNRNLVLKNIFDHDNISRAEISRITGLTRATVSDIVSLLIVDGLLEETGIGSSAVGKRPILLSLAEDSRWIIGLDLAHNRFRGAVVNLRGEIRNMVTLPVNDRNGEEALALVYDILDRLIAQAGHPLVGIGVGTPGLVNTSEGVVVNAVNLDWKNLPLAKLLQERYHLPVTILNDSQAAAIGEYTYCSEHHAADALVVINARHGIGAGIVIDGQLYYGGGSAGEIGHIVVVPEGGLPCRCGNYGCLETVASAQALIKRARILTGFHPESVLAQSPQQITLDSIERAFASHDPLASQLVLETARYLGLAISSLVGILNPEKVILAGDMTCFGAEWLEGIRAMIQRTSLRGPAMSTRVEIGRLGENGIVLGSSAVLMNDYALLFNQQEVPA